ncbi:MAG: Do family serine endopeptidase [Alphaproteobacteria bacterium]|nr:Do family serine endopeptidase [Alphaproteobacteria bacterium]
MKRILFLLCLFLLLLPSHSRAAVERAVPQSAAQIQLSFAPLVRQVTPAVVNIYTKRVVRQRFSPFFADPFFNQFFGGSLPGGLTRERMEKSLGSGVIVRPDGLVVTARHVIEGADQIRVVLSDRREYDARVVLSDEHSDLAVLRLDNAKGTTFPYLRLKNSDDAEVGDVVLAIGNPFGVGQTVTMGIISALTHKAVGAGDYDYFIQTDAAINPGNSGGALVTTDGKLIGINCSIYSRDGGNMGIGFAVPSNLVRLMIEAAEAGKKNVTHPWTGIEGQDMTQDMATSLGLPQPSGFLVNTLDPGSPAAKAGLRVGDVVASVNGRVVDDLQAFRYRIATLPISSAATLGIWRHGRAYSVDVRMIAPPENTPRDERLIKGDNPISGAHIANLSPAVAEQIGLRGTTQGVVVVGVEDNTPAANIGLQKGDILAAINGSKISRVADAVAALKKDSHSWRLTVVRGGNRITMMFSY